MRAGAFPKTGFQAASRLRKGADRMLDIFAPFKWEALFQRWPDILSAFGMTVGISALALLIALVLGRGVRRAVRVPHTGVSLDHARVRGGRAERAPAFAGVRVLRYIPASGLSLAAFWIGVLAIGIYHGGYISEVVRSGIGSIHRGQFEAAKSQGSRTGRPCS